MARGTKTGGRQKGTPNKTTSEIRVLLSEIVAQEIESIPEYLKAVDPEKRLQIIIKLMPYILPTYSEEPIKGPEISGKDFVWLINEQLKVKQIEGD